MTPPVVDLGTYTPPATSSGLVGNGETITLPGEAERERGGVAQDAAQELASSRDYVVVRISFHHRLVRGRYERDVTRLHVKEQSRWLLERHLEGLL